MLGNKYVVNRSHDHSFSATIEKGIDWGILDTPHGNTFRDRRDDANIAPRESSDSCELDARQDSMCDAIKAMFSLDLFASVAPE
jgi:hypothetical protein